MHSYEDRIRAVKLHIKLGKRLKATICHLGYPTKNSLIGWYRKYERSQELLVVCSRSAQKYSDQHKHAAVKHYLDHDRCIASTMRALGYPWRELLTEWIDELPPEVCHRLVGRVSNTLHSDALKSAAMIELCTRKTSAQQFAQKLAVCRHTLYNWKDQLLGREVPASMKRQNNLPPVPDAAELQR